jgi:hypothetical protein
VSAKEVHNSQGHHDNAEYNLPLRDDLFQAICPGQRIRLKPFRLTEKPVVGNIQLTRF